MPQEENRTTGNDENEQKSVCYRRGSGKSEKNVEFQDILLENGKIILEKSKTSADVADVLENCDFETAITTSGS